MAGVSDNTCVIAGDNNICPGDISLNFAGEEVYVNADVSCPFDAVLQSDFARASQLGVCNCTTHVLNKFQYDRGVVGEPLECECYACPLESNPTLGYAFICQSEIAGPCKSFNCDGVCNGELNFFDNDNTRAPTMAPTSGTNFASTSATVLLLVATTLLPFFRR